MNGEGIIRGGRAGNRANLLNVLGWCSVPRCECACASRGAAIGRNNRSDTEVAGPPGNGPCLGCEGSRDGNAPNTTSSRWCSGISWEALPGRQGRRPGWGRTRLMGQDQQRLQPVLGLVRQHSPYRLQTYKLNGMRPVPVPPSRANQSVIARPCLSDRGRP